MESSLENGQLKKPDLQLAERTKLMEEEFARYFHGRAGVLVALSGGLDSTTLLRLFCASSLKPKLKALHVNYRLRGDESDADAAFCQQLCAELGVALEVVTISADAPATGVQDWARQLRQAEFRRWQQQGYVVALAHQADDLAETVVFRLARGASLGHLLGMQRIEAQLWRPLLDLSRAMIAECAKQNSWDHREDSSNAKINYSRNYIRHEVIPRLNELFPGADRRLTALAREAQELEQYCLDGLIQQLGEHPKSVTAEQLCQMSEGVAFQALRLMLRAMCEEQASARISRHLWHQVYERVKSSQGQEIRWCFDLPCGLLFTFDHGRVFVVRAQQPQKRNRASQHQKGLAFEAQEAMLGPGAQLTVFFDRRSAKETTIRNDRALTKLLRASVQNKG